jgi:hypothetical protein
VQEQIEVLIESDTHHGHDARDIEYYQEAMGNFITERRTVLEGQFMEQR